MEISLKDGELPILVERIEQFIQTKNHVELFRWLSYIDSNYACLDRLKFYEALAMTYPSLVPLAHESREIEACKDFYGEAAHDCESIGYGLSQTLLHINNAYINKIGCDCGKPVDLFSESQETNISHHKHDVFYKWAYAHLYKK